MKYALWLAALGACVTPSNADETPTAERPVVQVAILLDTSGSMEGLIHQARTQLWSIVNELALAERDGLPPDLRVALYEYGNSRVPAESNWIRQVSPLTRDLDRISEVLFALTTDGGDEYCGGVIARAVDELEWSEGNEYRAIFIAGNEPFTQGPVDYREACGKAIERGIVVNTIHCGPEADGRTGEWNRGAELADGKFLNIDANSVEVAIAAPQDQRLAELNDRLNGTYLAYGVDGQERQVAQDGNAAANGASVLAERCITKWSSNYRGVNGGWDLVDACYFASETTDLAAVPDEQLPESLRGLSLEEKKAKVGALAEERKSILVEIGTLAEERDRYVAARRTEAAEASGSTLQDATRNVVREQLQAREFRFVR